MDMGRDLEYADTDWLLYFTLSAFRGKDNPKTYVDWQDIREYANLFKKKFFETYQEREAIGIHISKKDLMSCVKDCKADCWSVFSNFGDSYGAGLGYDMYEKYYKKTAPESIWLLLKEAAEELAKTD